MTQENTGAMPPQIAALAKSLGINAEGWNALDPNSTTAQTQKAEASLKRYERARIIADAFSGEKGAAALNLLVDQTIEAESWQPDSLGLINAIGFGIYREGQNSLVRWIRQQIRIAEQGPDGSATPRNSPKRRK